MSTYRSQLSTLFALILLSWSMTVILGPLVNVIAANFGVSNETIIGNISAVFLLIGGLLAFVWVAVEDGLSKRIPYSRKILLVFATAIWVCGLFLTSIAQTYEQLFSYQILTAIGYAAITPLAYSLAMDFSSPEHHAKTFGLLDVAASIGVGVGFLLSGILASFTLWNIPFVTIGTFGLILLGALLNLEEPPKGLQERELAPTFTQGRTYGFHVTGRGISLMLRKKANVLITLFNILLYVISGSISYYFIRMLVHDHGFAPSLATLFFLGIFSSQVIGTLYWTRRADRKYAQKRNGKIKVLLEGLLLGPLFLITAYILTFTFTNWLLLGLFAILMVLGTFFISGLIAISFATLGEINPPELWAPIFSVNNLAQTLGRGIGIAVMGILFTSYGGVYQWGFTLMECLSFLSIPFLLPLLSSIPHELNTLSMLLRERATILDRIR